MPAYNKEIQNPGLSLPCFGSSEMSSGHFILAKNDITIFVKMTKCCQLPLQKAVYWNFITAGVANHYQCFTQKWQCVVFADAIRRSGGEFSETKAPVSLGTCHPCLQCRGFGEGRENFLNVCHACTILLSEAHDCQLAVECAHFHCDDEASQASWHTD